MEESKISNLLQLVQQNKEIINVFLTMILGGTSANISKMRLTKEKFSLAVWAGDVVLAVFVGILFYSLALHLNWSYYLALFMVGIGSYRGISSIIFLESIIHKKLGVNKENEKEKLNEDKQ